MADLFEQLDNFDAQDRKHENRRGVYGKQQEPSDIEKLQKSVISAHGKFIPSFSEMLKQKSNTCV